MKILAQARSVVNRFYAVEYVMIDNEEEFYSFPANSLGEIDYDSMPPAALDSLMACQAGTYDVDGPYLVTYEQRYVAKAVGQCINCGEQVVLDRAINSCIKCDMEYTLDGVEYPRLQMVG